MNIITQVLLPLILAFIMLSMGLTLVIDDFKRVLKFPKAFTIGFILQMIVLPGLGFILAFAWFKHFGLRPEFAVGLVVIAACPGGVTSNLMTHLGKGDSALSISLTAIISIITVFSLPFLVDLGLNTFMADFESTKLDVTKAIFGVFFITTVPVILGMSIKAFKSDFADKIEPTCRKISSIFFVIIVIAAIAKDWRTLVENFSTIGPSTLTLNLMMMCIAFGVAIVFGLTKAQGRAITFECGLQNGTLAILVTATFLNDLDMMLPGAIYSILMFITGGTYLLAIMRKNKVTALLDAN